MSDDIIKIIVDGDTRGFSGSMTQAGRTLVQFEANLNRSNTTLSKSDRAYRRVLPTIRDYVLVLAQARDALRLMWDATFGWMKSIADTNGQIERMTFLLQGMSREASMEEMINETNKEVQFFLDQAEKMPFSMGEITNAAVKMKSVGFDPLDGSLNALTDAVARFGGDDQIFHRATVAIQQMAGKGVVSMEELRQQLGEAIPNAIKLMARSLGKTYRQLVDDVSKGTVDAQTALPLMLDQFRASFEGSGEALMSTWGGLLKRLETRWMKFQLEIGKTGSFDSAKDALESLVLAFDSNAVHIFAESIGMALKAFIDFIKEVGKFVNDYGPQMLTMIKAVSVLLAARFVTSLILSVRNLKFLGLESKSIAIMLGGTLVDSLKRAVDGMTNTATAALAAVGPMNRLNRVLIATKAVLYSMITPGGLFVTFLALLAAGSVAWFHWGESGRKAAEKLKKGLTLSEAEMVSAKNRLVELAETVDWAQGELDKWERRVANGAFGTSNRDEAAERVNRLTNQLSELREDIAQAESAKAIKVADARFAIMQKNSRLELQEVNRLYEQRAETIDEYLAKGLLSELTQGQALITAIKEQADQKVAIMNNQYELIRDAGEGATKQEAAAVRAQQGLILAAIEQVEIKSKESIARIQARNALSGIGLSAKADARVEKYMNNIEAAAVKAKAGISGASGELAKFKFLITEGKFKDVFSGLDKGSDEYREKLSKLISKMKESTDVIEAAKKSEAAKNAEMANSKKATALLSKAQLALSISMAEFNDPLNPDNKLISIKHAIESMREAMVPGSKDAVKFNREMEELVAITKDKNAVDFFNELADGTKSINAGLLTEQAAALREYQDKVEEANSGANLSSIKNDAARLKAKKILNDHLLALDAEYQDRVKSNSESLVDRITNNHITAAGLAESTIEQMTDQLATFYEDGKLNFKDFADFIIKQLARIAAEKTIVNLLDSFASFGSGQQIGGADGVITAGVSQNAYSLTPSSVNNFSNTTNTNASTYTGASKTGVDKINIINKSSGNVQQGDVTQYSDGNQQVLDLVIESANQPGRFRDNLKQAVK